MPPYHCNSKLSVIGQDELITLKQQQRKSFTDHCRTFYRHSLSIYDNGNDESITTSKEIMNVFNCLMSSEQEQQPIIINKTEVGYSQLVKCGLDGVDDQIIIELTKIRNEERKKAHEQGMKRRHKEFLFILDEISLRHEEDNGNHLNHLRSFISRYKENIGFHSVFAGMCNLLRSQIKNENLEIYWKFKSIAVTESIENAGESAEYFKHVVSMFYSCLRRVEDEEESDVDENALCWKVKPSLNARKVRKFLKCLPRKNELHAKPIGELIQTERVRNIDKDYWCFW